MKLRRTAVILALGSISLAAIACGSAATGDGDIGGSPAVVAPAEVAGVNVTDSGVTKTGESGPWLGADTVPVPEALAELLGLPAGERVVWVTPGGPADGLLILGDTIVAIDDDAIEVPGGLGAVLAARVDGESVNLTVVRGGENFDIAVTLAARPAHASTGSLAEIQGLFDRALSGELRFLDREGGEHSMAFASGTLSGVSAGQVTLARPGNGPMTVTLSPNVFVWIDGAPGTVEDLANETDKPAKVVTFDDAAVAVLVGGIIPPILETLEGLFAPEGLFGSGGNGLLDALGALEMLQGLFGAAEPPAPDSGL